MRKMEDAANASSASEVAISRASSPMPAAWVAEEAVDEWNPFDSDASANEKADV